MISVRRVATGPVAVLAAVTVSIALFGLMAANTSLALSSPTRVLTPEQQRLVLEKNEALGSTGLETAPATAGESSDPQPSRTFSKSVFISREYAESVIYSDLEANADVWARIASTRGQEAAESAKQDFLASRLDAISEIPPKGITIQVPGVELGTHSALFSQFTYLGGVASDPVDLMFYDKGSAAHVEWVMKYWTSTAWEDDDGGFCVGQGFAVDIWEAVHGGTDHWQTVDWGAQRVADQCAWGTRMHMRIFGALVPDSHGVWGSYSVGAAHKETYCINTHCLGGWEPGEEAVRDSFYDSSGNKLWFVGNVYLSYLGNSGYYKGFWNDGYLTVIELNY